MTAVGRLGLDKRLGDRFFSEVVTKDEAIELWRGNDMAAKIIEIWPNQCLRKGFKLQVATDDGDGAESKDIQAEIEENWKDLGFRDKLWQSYAWKRGYGGGAILLGADDGQRDWSLPLNEENIRKFDWMTELENDDLSVTKYYDDPQKPNFGKGEIYTLSGGPKAKVFRVHESRLIIFQGIVVSRRQMSMNNGWGTRASRASSVC